MTPCQLTSAGPPDVHLRGYDLDVGVEPDETEDLSFDATITDRFEIEDRRADNMPDALSVRPR